MHHQYTELGELAVMIFRLNTSLLTWGDEFGKKWRLTSTRWRILGALARANTPLTAPQIAQAMGLTRQGVQKQLNELREHAFLKIQTNPDHKRSCFYCLTAKGKNTFQKIDQAFTSISQEWAKKLDLSHHKTLIQTLQNWQNLIDNDSQ